MSSSLHATTVPTVDVAIVGAGITGLSIAWHLVRRGLSVAAFDGRGIGSGATAIQPGGVRQQWATAVACKMAREAFDFYGEIGARLQPAVDPGMTACGYLFVAQEQAELAGQRERLALQNSLGIPSREVTPAEAGELVEGLDASNIVGGVWCDQDGYFDRPLAVVGAFHDAAVRGGATFHDAQVQSLERDGDGWLLRLRGGSTARAGAVVVAAAWDTPALLSPLGIELPIEREPKYLFYSDPIRERLLEPLVIAPERHFAAKQLADGSVLASDLGAGSANRPNEHREIWHSNVRRAITELLPILEYVSFPVLVEGFYDVTPDRQPVLGPLDGHDGLFVAAGLNGRGLMMAPTIGRVLADGVVDGRTDDWIAPLLASRFADGTLTPELQVV
ncbi:FAD-binding oxidoreductase [Conexibacter sp. CPCC 206217]|uniref:NAD(P)/FAD-dependent oxidoreductase n=1 Tax=Conexibacter sp. CPCC 206217 TaxID=3064574 RepID=UPI00271F8480|nr:FAD-binding oxidoreductase [Conexibacter sp. CPCC 206217]MDO8211767.1 FAD-binding oxidoreductase [Conexibacter sp. CPCC 206217]